MATHKAAAAPLSSARPRRSKRKTVRVSISYFCLLLIALLTVLPFVWTLSTALKGQNEAIYSMPPRFIPETFTLENFATVWNSLPIPTYLWNSLVLAFFGVTLPLLFCTMAAFPLARMQFKGKQAVFLTIVATMMIPGEITMIPVYLILNKLQLLGSYAGIILPGAVSAFGIFLMRQGMLGIPKEIEESAIVDGAGVWRLWLSIMLPMVKPMMATLGILCFIGSWNNFLWPYLILNDDTMYPLTLGLYKLKGTFVTNTRLIAAGAVIALLPILIVFISFQNYFIKGVYSGAVKG